jgi:N-acetylneuraminate synthase
MMDIVEAIAESGADAIKLQTFKPDTITLDCNSKEFLISDKNSIWNKLRLFDLYKKSQTP